MEPPARGSLQTFADDPPLSAKVFFSSRCAKPFRHAKNNLVACLLTLSAASYAAEPPKPLPVLAGMVTKVNDGDSIEVRLDSGPARVRLLGHRHARIRPALRRAVVVGVEGHAGRGCESRARSGHAGPVQSLRRHRLAGGRRSAHQHQRSHAARRPRLGVSALHEGSEVLRHRSRSARSRSAACGPSRSASGSIHPSGASSRTARSARCRRRTPRRGRNAWRCWGSPALRRTDGRNDAGIAVTAIRGPVLTYTGDAFRKGLESTMRYEPDAIVAMAGGKITHFGPAARCARSCRRVR